MVDCRAERLGALRSSCLSLAKTCSIGFRSSEYSGKKKSLAPTERMSRRSALPSFRHMAPEWIVENITQTLVIANAIYRSADRLIYARADPVTADIFPRDSDISGKHMGAIAWF